MRPLITTSSSAQERPLAVKNDRTPRSDGTLDDHDHDHDHDHEKELLAD
jgi:hypothetical protein